MNSKHLTTALIRARTLGLGSSTLQILLHLQAHGKSPITALTLSLGVSPANLTSLLDGLERKRFIRRSRGKADRRVVFIAITQEGSAAVESILQSPSLITP